MSAAPFTPAQETRLRAIVGEEIAPAVAYLKRHPRCHLVRVAPTAA